MASTEEGAIRKFVVAEKNDELVLVEVNVGIAEGGTPPVNDFCRLCAKYLRINGVISGSVLLFVKSKPPQISPRDKIASLGLVLRPNPNKSIRICKPCLSIVGRLERDLATLRKWKENQLEGDETVLNQTTSTTPPASPESTGHKRNRSSSPPPSEPPRPGKKLRKTAPIERRGVTQVITTYPSRTTVKVVSDREAGIVHNIANQKWRTAANLLSCHKRLLHELKSTILTLINDQCRKLANKNNGFMLWKTSPFEIKSFSFDDLMEDLKRMSPFLLSVFNTVSNGNQKAACAALCIALRGRQPCMSAFAYHINSIIARSGIKKAVFNRLNKMCITTAYNQARQKQKKQAATIEAIIRGVAISGETVPQEEPSSELLNSDPESDGFAGTPEEPRTEGTDSDNPLDSNFEEK